LPHSPGCDEENLQPHENDEPNPPREGTPDSHVGSGIRRDPMKLKSQHAKAALQGEPNKKYKIVAEDWKNLIREKQ
jgi:hypothetical protein